MDYQYKLIVSNQVFYKEFDILSDVETIRLGTTKNCEFRLNPDYFFEKIEISFEKKKAWNIYCGEELYINKGDIRKLFFCELNHGDHLKICYSESGEVAFEIKFMIDFAANITDYSLRVDLSNISELAISNSKYANIQLLSEYCQNTSLSIKKISNKYCLVDISSEHGVYVNGKKIEQSVDLEDCDFISVADFFSYYKDNHLYFVEKNIKVNGIENSISYTEISPQYPLFVRNTRIKFKVNEEPINILEPANIPTKPEINFILSLLPAVAMFVLVVVLRGILSTTSSTFVIFSICSMGLGVITSILSIIDKKKRYKKQCEERKLTYNNYIENKTQEIVTARYDELQCLRDTYYSTEQDLKHIETFSSRLFDRIPQDEDFMDVYLGVGETKAKRHIEYRMQEKLELGDELCDIPANMYEQYKNIKDAPVVVKLKDANAIGVVGEFSRLYEMMKIMLVDIISRQYYGDVKIYLLIDDDQEKYDWIRLLPHIFSISAQRNIVCDTESKTSIFESLYKELNERSREKVQTGFNIVFVLDEHGIKSHPISKYIENASELNTVFVFFEEKFDLLPLYCSRVINILDEKEAELFESINKSNIQKFKYTRVSDKQIRNAVEKLAPVFCEEISLASSLRKKISLFELLGIYGVNDLNLLERWSSSKIYDSIAVPIGVNVKDEIVYLDLHEKYHGPHGLVAGTTGSGKSEILQTYILSAATLFTPYEIGFVIIDFKGGGMVNQFKDLPHLMGAITNIDGKAIDRSLKSIKAELLKRQNLFAEAEVNHIDKYIKAYKEGRVKTALPHLVIIVDEFAELKAEQPEFMKELISAARIGRSLGVHLILATQKPAGQVNEQIWSNSKFKLCLKVQTQEDSNEVLKSPLAAEIREPGRAYLQVGNNEIFELFQSGFSGCYENNDDKDLKSFDICALDFKGNRKVIYQQRPKKNTHSRTQLEAVVEYVHDYCEKIDLKKLPEICLPPLEDTIAYDILEHGCGKDINCSVSIGIYDNPDCQVQEKAIIDLANSNTLIIGSSQYGKTNLLETIIRNLAETYSPKEVNMYIIDFASMVLKNFESLLHVGGVVCPSDDEKLKNLFKYLYNEIASRREILLSAGVSSFNSYKEAGYKDLPQIVVLIDNFTALKELYLQDNDMLLNLCREGNSVGITFVISNMQTTGLGYKYMSNFANRIALFCNETSEYSNLYGPCKLKPDEIPGRCLIEIEKSIYECQTFLAFEGEKEIERIRNMQEFVNSLNSLNVGEKAIMIPEIPKLLGEKFLLENFGSSIDDKKQVIGLNYETVSPVITDLSKNNLIAISGAEGSGKTNFIKYFIHSIEQKNSNIEIFIIDNYKKKLVDLKKDNVTYELGGQQCKDIIANIDLILQEKYELLIQGKEIGNESILLVINNEDVLNDISNDKNTIASMKNIVNKYKMLNVTVLIGQITNAQIVYGSPELLKMVKEMRNIVFFDNIDNCKLVDVPLNIIRNNKKRIELGDAFYLTGNDCYKIKTPLAIK